MAYTFNSIFFAIIFFEKYKFQQNVVKDLKSYKYEVNY